jgi:hypothetical protein
MTSPVRLPRMYELCFFLFVASLGSASGSAQIARKTRPPADQWLQGFLAAPRGSRDYSLIWLTEGCPAVDAYHAEVLDVFLAHDFPDSMKVGVGQEMSLIARMCGEPRALRWVHDLIRARAPIDPELATGFLIGLSEVRSPEQSGFLEDLVRSGVVPRAALAAPVPEHSAGFDFESMLMQLLKRNLPPDRLSHLYFDALAGDLLTERGRTSLLSYLSAQRGDRLHADMADLLERRPDLIGRSDLLYHYFDALDRSDGDWRGRPGAERLTRALLALGDRSPESLDDVSRFYLGRLRRFFSARD